MTMTIYDSISNAMWDKRIENETENEILDSKNWQPAGSNNLNTERVTMFKKCLPTVRGIRVPSGLILGSVGLFLMLQFQFQEVSGYRALIPVDPGTIKN